MYTTQSLRAPEKPAQVHQGGVRTVSWQTPLGPMMAAADDAALYLLEFKERKNLDTEIVCLEKYLKQDLQLGENALLAQIQEEISAYFAGKAAHFTTPLTLWGSDFQQQVWKTLQSIPPGQTWSYRQQALAMGRVNAVRAVAHANAKNPLALIIPCHRVIQSDGGLGGYAAGIERKRWLIQHEQCYFRQD